MKATFIANPGWENAGVRDDVLDAISSPVPARPEGFVRVGIEGLDGSGKTTFADAFAAHLVAHGRDIVRIRADAFLNPRAIRHQRGRDSPEGFFLGSYDVARLRLDALDPFSPQGSGRCRESALDLAADLPLDQPSQQAEPGAVLVLDGMFLHRHEFADVWDLSVLLDVPFAETVRRMSVRDGSNPDPSHPSMRRDGECRQLYFRTCDPRTRADVVIDNTELADPRIVSRQARR